MSRPRNATRLDRARRAFRPLHLVAVTLGGVMLACADPASPGAVDVDGPRLLKEVEGRPQVLNFTLRAIEDPNNIDDRNISQAYGHLQLKLTVLADGSVRVAIKGEVNNPAGETFTRFTIGTSADGRGSELIAFGEVDGRTARHIVIDPEDATLSAEVAARLFGTPDTSDDPNLFVVTFFTVAHPAGAIGGTRALPAVQ